MIFVPPFIIIKEPAVEPRYLTPDEVALILRVHRNTIYNMCRRGQLVASKKGSQWRINNKEFQESLAKETNHES